MTTISVIEKVELSGISWETYENLSRELDKSRRLRLSYYYGDLEIMTPSPEHEIYKAVVGRFVDTLAEELDVYIYPLESTTFKKFKQISAEPDKCFYLKNRKAVQGKKRLDENDPPPDLVIEIDVTSSSQKRLEIYAEMRFPEIWRYDLRLFKIYHLVGQKYQEFPESLAFPNIPLLEIATFLKQVETTEYLDL